jgi:hypothetical protein
LPAEARAPTLPFARSLEGVELTARDLGCTRPPRVKKLDPKGQKFDPLSPGDLRAPDESLPSRHRLAGRPKRLTIWIVPPGYGRRSKAPEGRAKQEPASSGE